VSPGVGTRHLEGPKNPDGLNLGKCVFVYVYKVHMCIIRKVHLLNSNFLLITIVISVV